VCSVVEEQRKGHYFVEEEGRNGVGDAFAGCCYLCLLFVCIYMHASNACMSKESVLGMDHV
jgi:hypothetical protein